MQKFLLFLRTRPRWMKFAFLGASVVYLFSPLDWMIPVVDDLMILAAALYPFFAKEKEQNPITKKDSEAL